MQPHFSPRTAAPLRASFCHLAETTPPCAFYCRPIADFFAGKQQTADMCAEAVCSAGWRLDSAAAKGMLLVLSVCGSPQLCFLPGSVCVRVTTAMLSWFCLCAGHHSYAFKRTCRRLPAFLRSQ
jgi:hypothetical protein